MSAAAGELDHPKMQHKNHLHKRLDDDIYSATFETALNDLSPSRTLENPKGHMNLI